MCPTLNTSASALWSYTVTLHLLNASVHISARLSFTENQAFSCIFKNEYVFQRTFTETRVYVFVLRLRLVITLVNFTITMVIVNYLLSWM